VTSRADLNVRAQLAAPPTGGEPGRHCGQPTPGKWVYVHRTLLMSLALVIR
jgi:hypothetical protein